MSQHNAAQLTERLLNVLEMELLPKTRQSVAKGNKIFGAALLLKQDLSTFLVETNNETENPLWHGEIHTLKTFYEIPSSERPATSDLVFLSSHEPCSLCLSAITWAGFDNFYYFFSHQDSRDEFAIPHDLNILQQVFNVAPGKYNHHNQYWDAYAIHTMINDGPEEKKKDWQAAASRISSQYAELSDTYQQGKSDNDIPLR